MKLEFEISSTALNVNRELKTSLYLLFSGIIGMVAGVLESVGTTMGFLEDFVNGVIKKRGKHERFEKIVKKRERFNDFFIDNFKVKITKRRMSLPRPRCETLTNKTSRILKNRIQVKV